MLQGRIKKLQRHFPLYLNNGLMKNGLIILGLICMKIVSIGNEYPQDQHLKKREPLALRLSDLLGAHTSRFNYASNLSSVVNVFVSSLSYRFLDVVQWFPHRDGYF